MTTEGWWQVGLPAPCSVQMALKPHAPVQLSSRSNLVMACLDDLDDGLLLRILVSAELVTAARR